MNMRNRALFAILCAVIPFQIFVVRAYIARSYGTSSSPGSVELRNASRDRMLTRLDQLAKQPLTDHSYVADSVNFGAAELVGLAFRGKQIYFTSQSFGYPTAIREAFPLSPLDRWLNPSVQNVPDPNAFIELPFVDGATANGVYASAGTATALADPKSILLDENSDTAIINHPGSSRLLGAVTEAPLDSVHNRLFFITSSLGGSVWGGDSRAATLLFPEHDPFEPESWMQALNRYAVFGVINTSQKLRLRFDFTESLLDHGRDRLPNVRIDGKTRSMLPFIGYGSGRLISPPFEPLVAGGVPYLQLDLQRNGTTHDVTQPGVFGSFRDDFVRDPRFIVGYGREISVMSDEDYQKIVRPLAIDAFPTGLGDPNLEYSGIFEDGWLSTDAEAVFRAAPYSGAKIRLRGRVPLIDDNAGYATKATVSVDGEIHSFSLPVGEFDITVPALADSKPVTVGVHFDHGLKLPSPDDRIIGAQIFNIGYAIEKDDLRGKVRDVSPPGCTVQLGDGWYPSETYAGEHFRWISNDALVVIRCARSARYTLDAEIASGPSARNPSNFIVSLRHRDGSDIGRAEIAGRGTVKFPVEVDSGTTLLSLHVDSTGVPASQDDHRILSMRVFKLVVR